MADKRIISIFVILKLFDMQSAKIILPGRYSALTALNRMLKQPRYEGCRFLILVDENTYTHCLPTLISHVEVLQVADFLEVPVGEEAKTLEIASQLWSALQESSADHKTVIINLGGGCVSDLGGFVAAGYLRGIHYINVPTTLLSMVDAAIGGKTALNLNGVKNQVGFFYQPDAIVIEPAFLQTLSASELKSGLFELLKTLMLSDADAYQRFTEQIFAHNQSLTASNKKAKKEDTFFLDPALIAACAKFKADVTKADPNDHGIRHILNLGHTFGHAIEAYSRQQGNAFSHGVAVGLGLACALYLSANKLGFPSKELERYVQVLRSMVQLPRYTLKDTEALLSFMRLDKKNADGLILCVLLQDIAVPVIDVEIDENEIRDAILTLFK